MSNIKAAPCLARIVAPGNHANGWIVQVLNRAPIGEYRLPDGFMAMGESDAVYWVCESLMHSPFNAPILYRGKWSKRQTRYSAIDDPHLRPLPGIEDPTQVDERIPESEAA